jgi:hypothetical protein
MIHNISWCASPFLQKKKIDFRTLTFSIGYHCTLDNITSTSPVKYDLYKKILVYPARLTLLRCFPEDICNGQVNHVGKWIQ